MQIIGVLASAAVATAPTDLAPPRQHDIGAGGNDVYQGADGYQNPKQPIITLAEQLDGCLYPQGVSIDRFSCVAITSRAAARHYKRLSGKRSWESEVATSTATLGFGGLAASLGHAAKNTVGAWSFLALGPVIADDIASPGPRARLYTVASTAMTQTTTRAEDLREKLAQAQGAVMRTDAGPVTLQQQVHAWCAPASLDAIDGLPLPKPAGKAAATNAEAEAAKKAKDKLSGQIRARCDQLVAAEQKLSAASALWGYGGDGFARGLALDATILDDTITRLDRQTLAPARGALSVVLNAALNLPGKLVGGATPPEYVGRNLPVFTTTYTFNLARAPDADLPSLISADLSTPAGVDGPDGKHAGVVQSLNRLTTDLNLATAAANDFKTINDRSILSVSPGGEPAVTLTSPTRP
jgi:hypothetical protein